MYQNIPSVDKMQIPNDMFKEIKYYLVGSIDEKVEEILNAGGAKRDHYLSEMCSHAIADDPTEPDCSEAKELFELPVVTSQWVVLSAKCGVLLPTEGFCPDESALFTEIVACPSQLSGEDAATVWALITQNGGECQTNFNNNVTHLVAAKPGGPKYECALRHPEHVKVVTPDWVTGCTTHNALLDENDFHPRLLQYEIRAPTPPPAEAMDTGAAPDTPVRPPGAGTPPRTPQHQTYTPKAGANATYHYHPNSPRNLPPEQPVKNQPHTNSRTKEALARMVSSRLGGAVSPGHLSPGYTPGSPGRALSPGAVPTPDMMLRMPGVTQGMRSPRGMLRNITNDGTRFPRSPRSPRGRGTRSPRGSRGRGAAKINQLMGLSGDPMVTPPRRGRGRGRGASNAGLVYGSNLHQMALQQQMFQQQQLHQQQQQQQHQLAFYGHDPIENIPPAACLLGCVFYITDYQKYLEKSTIDLWRKVIVLHGGEVDESYSNRVTHVMCEHQKSDVFQLALRDGKRLVTAHWLNDTITRRKLSPPWLALHFPLMWSHDEKPCTDQIVCVTNFLGEDRTRLKHMLAALGAKYTGYMSHAHSVLIAKKAEGPKYLKAVEWRIPVVNVTWLNDLLLGDLTPLKLPVPTRFLHYTDTPFKLDIWRVAHLLDGWKAPIRIPKEAWKRFQSLPQLTSAPSAASGDVTPASTDTPATDNTAPGVVEATPESAAGDVSSKGDSAASVVGGKRKAEDGVMEAEPAEKKQRQDENVPPPSGDGPVVIITGVPKSKALQLNKDVEKLGGTVTAVAKDATHLVAKSIARTVKFLTGLSIVKHVLSPEWVERSASEGRFLPEDDFVLQDANAEAEFGFTFAKTLERVKSKKVFEELSFYITPEVTPSRSTLRDIVESAGGKVFDKMPRISTIRKMKNSQGDPTYITITCETDLFLCQPLVERKLGVHTAEFILTGVMKQEIDYESYRLA